MWILFDDAWLSVDYVSDDENDSEVAKLAPAKPKQSFFESLIKSKEACFDAYENVLVYYFCFHDGLRACHKANDSYKITAYLYANR